MDFSVFSEDAQLAVTRAVEEAALAGASSVRPEHVRLAIKWLEYERLREELREGPPPTTGQFRLPLDRSLTQRLEAAAASGSPDEPVTGQALAAMLDALPQNDEKPPGHEGAGG